MSENKFEALSALVDQHDVDTSKVEQIKNDDQLNEAWGRYHLIGDVIRGEHAEHIDLDLSDDIAVAIAAEPTILAPMHKPSLQQAVKAKVVTLFKPAGQLAIAASAAWLMVLGVQQSYTSDDVTPMPAQVFQPFPVGGVAEPVSYNFEPQSISTQKRLMIERQQKLQAILSDHQMQRKLNPGLEKQPENEDQTDKEPN
ncbi:sigma-E factor negative regulatory protein [Thalassotalea aquiviva]|uniref:sigma-E factor negative regulatory protein n=1 Tax=Thalassotalea aquiviva TaxID=3242415 RepID=UPI00352B504C